MTTGVVDRVRVLSRALDDVQSESLDDASIAELGEALIHIDRALNRLRHAQARLTARFDAAGGALRDGLQTAAAWLRVNTSAAPGESAELVRVARQLRDRLPNTDAALACGDISWRAAATIAHGLRSVSDDNVVAEAEALLAAEAPSLDTAQLAHAVRRTVQWIDPDSAQRDARQRYQDRCVTLAPMLDGSVAIAGQLDDEGAAVLQSALIPLMAPLGPDDRRSAAQRRHDALIELVTKAAADGAAGGRNAAGLPPTLLVRVDVEQLALDGQCAVGSEMAPIVSREVRRGRGSSAELDWGGPVLREAMDRIGCSAQVIRLVTAGESRVLDVGTAQRLATPAQRIALGARDGGCCFPGCDRPPGWTDAHHVSAWREGGPTDLDNLVSLCRFHHRLVHEGGWALRRGVGGVDFVDPRGAIRGSVPVPIVGQAIAGDRAGDHVG